MKNDEHVYLLLRFLFSSWIPAFAGMTKESGDYKISCPVSRFFGRIRSIKDNIMFKKIFLFSAIVTLFAAVALPAQAQLRPGIFERFAQDTFGDTFQTENVDVESTLPEAIGQIISLFLGLVGVVMLVIFVYAGFEWLTAGGNEDKVTHAKKLIRNAVIGLIIALSAFVLTSFVIQQITSALSSGGTGTGTGTSTTPAPSGTTPSPERLGPF